MNARSLTGSALKAVLRKAAEAGIGEAVTRNAALLSEAIAAVDEAPSQRSLPAGGRAGEGAFRLATSLGARSGRSASLLIAAPELFAREFGAVAMPAAPLVGPAIDRLKRRRR